MVEIDGGTDVLERDGRNETDEQTDQDVRERATRASWTERDEQTDRQTHRRCVCGLDARVLRARKCVKD